MYVIIQKNRKLGLKKERNMIYMYVFMLNKVGFEKQKQNKLVLLFINYFR